MATPSDIALVHCQRTWQPYSRSVAAHMLKPFKTCWLGVQAQVYDAWVLRDGEGRLFDLKPPFQGIHSNYTRARLLQGLPFPVTTCWNGMVVMPAKPFREGLRIRQIPCTLGNHTALDISSLQPPAHGRISMTFLCRRDRH
jgi:hypothetical protein